MENLFDYDELQSKLHPTSEPGVEDDASDTIEDQDDWTIVDPLDESGEGVEEDDTPEDAGNDNDSSTTPPTDKKDKPTEPTVDELSLKESMIRQLGDDFTLKVKGVERKLKDIPAIELKNGLQKAFRSDQIFNDLSAERRQVEDDRRRFEEQRQRQEMEFNKLRQELELLQRGIRPDPSNPFGQAMDEYGNPISPTDSPDVRRYKFQLAETQKKLSEIENGMRQTSQQAFVSGVENEIKTLSKEYPMAPLDEVIAVKLARPEVRTEDLMKAAHDYYRGDQHIELALANNPEFLTKLKERFVKEYVAKRQSAKKIVGVKKGSSGSTKVTGKAPAVIRDFRGAEAAAKKYIAELERQSRE